MDELIAAYRGDPSRWLRTTLLAALAAAIPGPVFARQLAADK